MTQPRAPIGFSTRTLDSTTGVSQVALDIMVALAPHAAPLRVRAWVPHALPSAHDGHSFGDYQFEALPLAKLMPALLSGEAPPRALLEHTRLRRSGATLQPCAALEIVNGLGAHGLYRALASTPTPGTRSCLVVHESPRHFEPPGRLTLAAALQALRSYDYCVFVSERGRREWLELAGLSPLRTAHIPNCVRELRAAAVYARERPQLREAVGYDERRWLVCVGALSERKGQDLVVAALRALPPDFDDVCVEFIGARGGEWAERLIGAVEHSPLSPRVRFAGRRSDVYERVHAADALVSASRAEASPLVVLEAMALGACVVAADVDGVGEQVVHAQTGCLFGRNDVAGLVECLQRIAASSALRAALGGAARARYRSVFERRLQLARWSEAIARMRTGAPLGD
jgi:glycosyltransferase involved in cell wall biosynthesis